MTIPYRQSYITGFERQGTYRSVTIKSFWYYKIITSTIFLLITNLDIYLVYRKLPGWFAHWLKCCIILERRLKTFTKRFPGEKLKRFNYDSRLLATAPRNMKERLFAELLSDAPYISVPVLSPFTGLARLSHYR